MGGRGSKVDVILEEYRGKKGGIREDEERRYIVRV